MTTQIRAIFLSFLFLISSSAFADSKRYFIAPDISASGTVVNGVDVSSGRLNRSDNDLSSSTLSFSRV